MVRSDCRPKAKRGVLRAEPRVPWCHLRATGNSLPQSGSSWPCLRHPDHQVQMNIQDSRTGEVPRHLARSRLGTVQRGSRMESPIGNPLAIDKVLSCSTSSIYGHLSRTCDAIGDPGRVGFDTPGHAEQQGRPCTRVLIFDQADNHVWRAISLLQWCWRRGSAASATRAPDGFLHFFRSHDPLGPTCDAPERRADESRQVFGSFRCPHTKFTPPLTAVRWRTTTADASFGFR